MALALNYYYLFLVLLIKLENSIADKKGAFVKTAKIDPFLRKILHRASKPKFYTRFYIRIIVTRCQSILDKKSNNLGYWVFGVGARCRVLWKIIQF